VVSIAKEETYTIEGINADLRTYLGRRKRRSRCFSRSAAKQAEAVRLFVWHYNRRQRVINAIPAYRGTLPLPFSPLPDRAGTCTVPTGSRIISQCGHDGTAGGSAAGLIHSPI
jgi:hypothetical protein